MPQAVDPKTQPISKPKGRGLRIKRPLRFTDNFIKSLPTTGQRYDVREASKSGLTVRVGPTGSKVWQLQFRFDGKPWRMNLGRYPAVSLADANVKVADARQKLERGENPAQEAVAAHKAAKAAQTVNEVVDTYLEQWAVDGKRHRREERNIALDRRILDKDVRPVWGKRKANSIKRADVAALIDAIKARGAPAQANRTLTVLRVMFKKAHHRGIIDDNPCLGIDRPSPEVRRSVVLDNETIRSFWLGLDGAKMSPGMRVLLRLALVTAQRRGEVVSIEKSELDLAAGTWFLPASKVKNRRDHLVPLSPLAVDLIREAWRLSGGSRWLFPSRSGKGERHVTGPAVDHAMRNNRIALGLVAMDADGGLTAEQDMSRVPTPHDLRRTAASTMTAAGIPRLHVDQLLNHVDGSVGATYDRHTYWPEKLRAVTVWEGRLLDLVERREPDAENVVALRA